MRKKFVPNPDFFSLYPYVPPAESLPPGKHTKRRPVSTDSIAYHEEFLALRTPVPCMLEGPSGPETDSEPFVDEPGHENLPEISPSVAVPTVLCAPTPSVTTNTTTDTITVSNSIQSPAPLSRGTTIFGAPLDDEGDSTLLRLLEPGDIPRASYTGLRVSGLDTIEGTFVLSLGHAYFLHNYALTTRGCLYEKMAPVRVTEDSPKSEIEMLKWAYEDLRDLRRRRFCLQDRGIELFSNDGNNTLLAFKDPSVRDLVYTALLGAAPSLEASAPEESVAGMHRDAKIEREGNPVASIFTLIQGKSLTQRWVDGDMTNFQYLTHLNTLSGRSYNDLNQYPVFPWIIADYLSTELDLSDACTYRDLGKPMGGQTPKRAEEALACFETWEDATEEKIPPFHYGTHYSSAAIVASYLVRMEPFTQAFLKLQGGHFDHADRMFHSIHEAWISSSEKNRTDVRELIPEFFYLPDFLLNTNNFDLGRKQDGELLHNVVLPPWAKGSPTEFIRVHRQALESEYVSSRLHEWIDLIFGYKQQGEEARTALNVFHHLTYEGAVDLDAMTDAVQRNATISIINNFGQTPKQLFKRPHPQKRLGGTSLNTYQVISLCNNPKNLHSGGNTIKDIGTPVGHVGLEDGRLLILAKNQIIYNSSLLSWNRINLSLSSTPLDGKIDGITYYENLHLGAVTCAVALASSRLLITGGVDGALRVWVKDSSTRGRGPVRSLILHHVLVGHVTAITCLAIIPTFGVLISGADDGTCIIWDLTRLSFVRSMPVPYALPVCAIAVNNLTGDIVTCSRDAVYLWSINGGLLGSSPLAEASKPGDPLVGGTITCCTITELSEWTDDFLIVTGYSDGRVKIWYLTSDNAPKTQDHSRQMVYITLPIPWLTSEGVSVTAVNFSSDQKRLFVGDVRGRVFQWSFPDVSGKASEHWVQDGLVSTCMMDKCTTRFSYFERRHHCRYCGKVFCQKCSAQESVILSRNIYKPVRVCDICFTALREVQDVKDVPPASPSSLLSIDRKNFSMDKTKGDEKK